MIHLQYHTSTSSLPLLASYLISQRKKRVSFAVAPTTLVFDAIELENEVANADVEEDDEVAVSGPFFSYVW